MANRLACPIMPTTTIYHCPQVGFVDNLSGLEKFQTAQTEDNLNN
ncbi:hypothetical protein [Acetobacterium bakii]|nr:hypothetical protein [Acetobacterium bakii]